MAKNRAKQSQKGQKPKPGKAVVPEPVTDETVAQSVAGERTETRRYRRVVFDRPGQLGQGWAQLRRTGLAVTDVFAYTQRSPSPIAHLEYRAIGTPSQHREADKLWPLDVPEGAETIDLESRLSGLCWQQWIDDESRVVFLKARHVQDEDRNFPEITLVDYLARHRQTIGVAQISVKIVDTQPSVTCVVEVLPRQPRLWLAFVAGAQMYFNNLEKDIDPVSTEFVTPSSPSRRGWFWKIDRWRNEGPY